jgi:hypothetical protein
MLVFINSLIANIVAKFAELNGAKFVGIREYCSSTSGEVCNHVVNANFSYGKAVQSDLKKLKNSNSEDVQTIAEKFKVTTELVEQAILDLTTSFEKNMNPETASKQSIAQKDAYIPVTNAIKLHKETLKLHIYALSVWKGEPIVEGVYKEVNSRPLTIAKNAVKKYFNFTTAKYRNFIIDPSMLSEVAINGEVMGLK